MKELHLTMVLRNNRLLQKRMGSGLTQAQVSEAAGVSRPKIWEYERLSRSPVDANGEWRTDAMRIANFWCCTPEQLWPDSVRKVRKSVVRREFDVAEIHNILSGSTQRLALPPDADEVLDAADAKNRISEVLNVLSEREELVLRRRFGLDDDGDGRTHREIADELGLSKGTISMIEMRALRRLRHPTVASVLKGQRENIRSQRTGATTAEDAQASERRKMDSICPNPWKSQHATKAAWKSGYVFALELPPDSTMPTPRDHPTVHGYCGGEYPTRGRCRQAFIDGWNFGRGTEAEATNPAKRVVNEKGVVR